jgi:hypothetical protein
MGLVIEIAGWVAAGVLLAAYALLSHGRLHSRGSPFQALNVAGSLVVGVNSLAHEAWPSASVNLVWLVIGVATLVATHRRGRRATTGRADGGAPAALPASAGRSTRDLAVG